MDAQNTEIQNTVIEFIENKLIVDSEQPKLHPGQALFGTLLDSLSILRLMVFIEEQFSVHVEDEELLPENFQTVERIAVFIQHKLVSAGGAVPDA